jgi:hypothetical protein
MPHVAAAIEAQIDCDDAGDDFVKEKLHSNIHSSSTEFDDLAVAAEVLRVRFGSIATDEVEVTRSRMSASPLKADNLHTISASPLNLSKSA